MGKDKDGTKSKDAKPEKAAKAGPGAVFDIDDPVFPEALDERALKSGGYPYDDKLKRGLYEDDLQKLQLELIKLQAHIEEKGERLVVVFEGRDTSGKGGCISRILERINPRHSRSVALSKPTEAERGQWYFQRYISHLPTKGDLVLFDRSWYNRAGVERVMGFCSETEHEIFLKAVLPFEHMLIGSGIHILKYYLDISRDEQRKRLRARRTDPLKQWKVSPIDRVALKHWTAYSEARDQMLAHTSSSLAPWLIVRADDKRSARLNVIRDLISRLACPETDKHLAMPDRRIVFPFKPGGNKARMLSP